MAKGSRGTIRDGCEHFRYGHTHARKYASSRSRCVDAFSVKTSPCFKSTMSRRAYTTPGPPNSVSITRTSFAVSPLQFANLRSPITLACLVEIVAVKPFSLAVIVGRGLRPEGLPAR